MTADSIVAAAVANNAAWCDLVCRCAGLATVRGPALWSTPRRSPVAYPDAVTLRPNVPEAEVLGAVDDSPGASVKDSFADLDLAPYGWSVLFDARWVTRSAPSAAALQLPWRTVDRDALPRWLDAHGSDAITPGVLDDPDVRLLLAADGDVALAVAALNRSGAGTRTVVGVSNVQALAVEPDRVWSDLVLLARDLLGPHPLVGYESGDDLAAPLTAGFEPVGPLRVWLR
ncbi:hypothetical protein [Cellulomonas xylanilytica]|nr:hypothetical protein [Cellulomonas xylanilytica]